MARRYCSETGAQSFAAASAVRDHRLPAAVPDRAAGEAGLALQLRYRKASESMGNHDSEIVDAGSVD